MPADTKWNFDWSGRLEQLEERLAMSADPLGGFLGGTIEHHTIDDAPPALEHHTESNPDFWIDSSNQTTLNDHLRQIDKALEEAHGQTGLLNARANYGFTGIGQTVAVIDSGIAYDHFALGGGFGSNYRVVGGWDFTEENDANPYDDGPSGSHGTHVAGIVGGDSGNDTGVAPGVDLVALRVFNDAGAGYFSWVENALDWIHTNRNNFENPITAVNLSLGVASWNSDTIPSWANLEDEFAQLEADGIFIAVSAGNSYTSFNTTGLSYPAASSYVIPVMSTDDSGLMSYFSQRHSRAIAAPGRTITSTVPDYAGNNNGTTDDYATMSGTSMAAPYVAGASVIIREAMEFVGYTNITQDTIYDHMMATADSFFDSATSQWYSRLNVEAAIDALMPADDFGSDVANAYGLGTLSSTLSTSGVIGTMTDVDYFGFTAGSSGTVSMAVTGFTHELLPNCTVVGAEGTLENNVLTFDVVAGETYQVSLGTTAGIGYYDIGLTLDAVEAIVTPVDPVTIKTMVRNDGLIFSLDSENWLSVNGNRIWSNTYDFAVTDDLSIYWHSTNGYLQRLSSQGTWTTLDLDVTKFDVDASGVVYSLDADNVLSINGAAVWSYTADFEIADDQTIFWHCTNGYLMHRLANGSWEVFDDDANRFAVRSNGTVYSLGNDGWLNINGAIAWSGTQDFAFTEDQTLYWFSSTGMLQQLPNGGPWETLDTGVTQFAVGHDGANYSLSNNGEVSINGVATWSNIVDMRTDEMGYLVLEDVNGSLQRVAGRFELSSELALQSSVTSNSVSETDSEAANLAANSLDAAGQYFRGTTVSNHVVEKLGAVGSNSYQPADHFFSQAVRTDQDAFAWDHLLADNSSQQADFNFDRIELTEKDHGNDEQSLDAETVDSLFEHLGVLV